MTCKHGKGNVFRPQHRQRTMGTWEILRLGGVEEPPGKENKTKLLSLSPIAMSKLLSTSIADSKILLSLDLNAQKS